MKFNKKFNIKKFVKVSAVALAMISAGGIASTVNANTNVHADSSLDSFNALMKQNHASDLKIMIHTDRTDPTIRQIDETSGDPQVREEFNKVHKSIFKPGYKKGNSEDQYSDFESLKHLDGAQKANQILHIGPSNEVPTTFSAKGKSVDKVANPSKPKQTATPSKSKSKRTHLSKATVRKIMNSRRIMKRMKADKRAIRKDKKRLSSRNARKFMRNYTKRSKSLKRTKRAQKRAMAVKGAKRYVRYYKDEVKHEKDLVSLIKSNRVSKVTKRYVRRSLKRVRKNIRKNRKNVKRAHKITRHHSNKDRK